MKLFLITQNETDGYDIYDAAVVCALDAATARRTYPRNGSILEVDSDGRFKGSGSCWASRLRSVKATYLGEAGGTTKPGVVCASFNNG